MKSELLIYWTISFYLIYIQLDVQKSLHLDSRMLGVSKNWNSKACEEEMFCMQLPFEKNT